MVRIPNSPDLEELCTVSLIRQEDPFDHEEISCLIRHLAWCMKGTMRIDLEYPESRYSIGSLEGTSADDFEGRRFVVGKNPPGDLRGDFVKKGVGVRFYLRAVDEESNEMGPYDALVFLMHECDNLAEVQSSREYRKRLPVIEEVKAAVKDYFDHN